MNVAVFPIVGIGASAGGLDAFHKFFDNLPAETGMAFVMILHLPADRKSMLADILRRWTTLRVVEAIDGTLVKPNCVYVPPPHAIVKLIDGHLGVQMPGRSDLCVPRPIDAFFDSLGAALREHAVTGVAQKPRVSIIIVRSRSIRTTSSDSLSQKMRCSANLQYCLSNSRKAKLQSTAEILVSRTSYLVPRTSYLVPRTSYVVSRTT